MTGQQDRSAVERATGALFEQLFPQYDEEAYRASVELFRRRFEANGFATDWFVGKECLDAGCGGGRYSLAMAMLGAGRVEGVDLGEASILDARRRAQAFGLSQVRFEVASILDLPFPDAAFDFVCCSGVLMIVSDPERALTELTRVLRPDGLLYLLVYATEGLRWPLVLTLRPLAQRIGLDAVDRAISLAGLPVNKRRTYLDDFFCPILDFYTWARLREMLERHGYHQLQRWDRGRFDHEESLAEYRRDLEALGRLWEAGAEADDAAVRPQQALFAAGRDLVRAVVTAVAKAEREVAAGVEAEAMARVIGQGHHRVLARLRS